MAKFFQKYLTNIFSILTVGILLAVIIFNGLRMGSDAVFSHLSVSNIFESSIYVQDFRVGENPLVLYNSIKHQTFEGDFIVEVKRLTDNVVVCRGSGYNIKYSPDIILDNNTTTFDWYVGAPCSALLTNGKYYLETRYNIRVPGKAEKYLKTISNIFTVKY